MLFYKDCIVLLSVLMCSPIAAMKRSSHEQLGSSKKKQKLSSITYNWVGHSPISSKMSTDSIVPSQRKSAELLTLPVLSQPATICDLKATKSEQRELREKFSQPYHVKMISHGIRAGDHQKICRHIPAMGKSSFDDNDLIARIFSHKKFSQSQKINCAMQLEHIGVKLARTDFNGTFKRGLGIKPLNMAPLHIAAEREETQVVEHLLSRGIDPNVQAKRGSAVFYARDIATLEVLRRGGADLAARDRKGNTVLHFVAGNQPEDKEVAAYFLSHAVPSNEKNNQGLTPYENAQLNFGENFTNSDLKEHELAAKVARTAVIQTVGKPMVSFLHGRETGNRTRFHACRFRYDVDDSDSDN